MVFCLYLAIFTFFLSAYMFIPLFALYVKELGGSYAEFAIVLSVTGFVLSAVQSYVGYLSDKVGSRFLVIGGGSVSAVGFLLIGITYDKLLILSLYLLMNIGMGILIPAVFTLISSKKTAGGDSFIPIYRSIQGAGVIAGPMAGGWLVGRSFRANAFCGSLLMIASVLLFAVYLIPCRTKSGGVIQCGESKLRGTQGDMSRRGKKARNFKEAVMEVIHNKSFVVIMLLFTCIELSYDLISMSLPITGAELNFSTDIIGTALSAYYLMFTLFQIPVNKALRKLSRRTALILMGSLSLLPCGLLLLDIPAYYTVFIMGGVGLTIGSLFTYCSVLASEESPEDKKGTFMGVFNTIMPFTDVISPVMAAFFIGINVRLPYAAAAVLVLLFVILSGFFFSDSSR